MKRIGTVILFTSAFAVTGCNHKGEIPVIGLDDQGNPVQVMVPGKTYSKHLLTYASTAQDSVVPALGRNKNKSKWMLRTVTVGIRIVTDIGIGPFRVGAVPRARLIFTNHIDPSYP